MNPIVLSVILTIVSIVLSAVWLYLYRSLLPGTMKALFVIADIALVIGVAHGIYAQWSYAAAGLVIFAACTTLYLFHYYYSFNEMVVLVNDQNQPLGVAEKLPTHNANTPVHRAFSVFLFNNKGELMLQQRALHKKTWAGVWSNSCCGHVMLYESNMHAAHRRTGYELGLRGVKLYEILPNYRYRAEKDGVVENEFCPVFVGFLTDQQAVPNPKEVHAISWMPWQKFLNKVSQPGHEYSPWAAEEAQLLAQDDQFKRLMSTYSSLGI